ncbi:hypothetical protein Q5Y75_02245 [Ruegeria sp. 2205SS24-7]|uniref:hypothetical protein n=1 Tax=Ruegeria discodermiae TaxID=3064389 RepID=UPI0027421C33|nr:hypothetical protein [Ruegeria sp. 2205SS24-7]MDP5216029.1 hypothetical protein [Ruegeria sp. 2205SS24-7]
MKRMIILALALCLPLMAKAQGPVLVTLGGDLATSNLPARGEDDGGLFGFLDITYANGMGFDANALGAMEQYELTVPFGPPGQAVDRAMTGPRLADVMAQAGATGKIAIPIALDGYRAEISWEQIERFEPILATHADQKPLALGGYGPSVVIFPKVEDPALTEELGNLQVWAVAYIGIE